MYKQDTSKGVLEKVAAPVDFSDSKLHKVMLQQAKDAFVNLSDSALHLGESVEDSKKLHIGIIGCGRIGQLHAANIVNKIPDAELVCVSDVFESAAIRLAKEHNVPMACTDYKDLINNAAVHAVIVCSPTDTHAEVIRACAAAGKHIFCEKPVDKNLEVIDELSNVIDQSGVKFFLGFQRRWDTHFERAKKARESGFLGTPLKLHLTSRDPAPPPIGYLKQSGGLFLDMSSHDFDMARFLIGSDVAEVMATAVAEDPEIAAIGDHDHTLVTLRFENGCIGTIDNSRSSALGYDQRAEFFGTAGSINVGNVHPNMCEYADKSGVHVDSPLNFFMERYSEAYLREMICFVETILEDKPLPCGIEDGRLTVIYAAAARLSLKENRVVKISEVNVPGGDKIGATKAAL